MKLAVILEIYKTIMTIITKNKTKIQHVTFKDSIPKVS